MTKKQSVARNKTNVLMIAIGTLLLVLTPFIVPIITFLQELQCERDSFDNCTLSSNLMAGIIAAFLPYVFFALGLMMIIVGSVRGRKK